ncbi:uncharacterized protein LOC115989117 isoform X2 [Quercus lobata]|uniref:uncharacterized protein LOC115989117 isoform X2 n=1 Tax=Quercus lobata TaxID=97700 RepID=UPI001244716E|nr:uncharacterized protein LOC115989117 isoform X2 [Quercus lobata]XP_030968644.1 uncharacterized protein LOC115989117 isoform X2 [Quercus lobata]
MRFPNLITVGPPRFEGVSRFGDRDGYRGGPRGPPGEFGGEKGGAPPDFQPSYRGLIIERIQAEPVEGKRKFIYLGDGAEIFFLGLGCASSELLICDKLSPFVSLSLLSLSLTSAKTKKAEGFIDTFLQL